MCVTEQYNTDTLTCNLNIKKSGTYKLNSEQNYISVISTATTPAMISIVFVVKEVKQSLLWIIWVIIVVVVVISLALLLTFLFIRNKKLRSKQQIIKIAK
ncbi:Hypothetical_protein [Hexamita inflata]|uniref:Hypothetical_protein n=1 Tax=Hexamita inflata TaxID=28002 RepID=A0AA86QH66_9EUKA|nr:Hypothetical protein HINF_LOCUS46911 [Hexamita inflata]